MRWDNPETQIAALLLGVPRLSNADVVVRAARLRAKRHREALLAAELRQLVKALVVTSGRGVAFPLALCALGRVRWRQIACAVYRNLRTLPEESRSG